MNNSQIRIGQLNTQHSKTAQEEIRKISEDQEIDILCLQEPYARRGKIPFHSTRARIISADENPMSAIIVFNKHLTVTIIQQVMDEWTTCVEVKTATDKFIVVSIYFQCSHEIHPYLRKIRQICSICANQQIILCLDSNAKSVLWDSPRTDCRGEALEELIMELNLDIINKPGNPPTFCNSRGSVSYIDVTLATQTIAKAVTHWKVDDNTTSSDHNAIWFTIGGQGMDDDSTPIPKYALNKINLEKSLCMGDKIGGHLVSGHIDATAQIIDEEQIGGSIRFFIKAPDELKIFIAQKGSIALDGISLTINSVDNNIFDVLIINHTLNVTNWKNRKVGDIVNMEIDQLSRYCVRFAQIQHKEISYER